MFLGKYINVDLFYLDNFQIFKAKECVIITAIHETPKGIGKLFIANGQVKSERIR